MIKNGFTLIEVMITVAIISILASVALPSYTQYIVRSRLTEGSQSLASMGVTMDQYFMDTGSYLKKASTTGDCGRLSPTNPKYMTYSCSATATTFLAKMSGTLAGTEYEFTLNEIGERKTTKPETKSCWKIGSSC